MEAQGSNNNEKNNIKHEIKDLSFHLGEIAKLKNFAESLHSLYYHKKLSRSLTDDESEDVSKYEKIRDETRNDAVSYLELQLPEVENLLTSIQTLFEYYNSFSDEEWLKYINEDIKESKKMAGEVKKNHKLIKLEERLNSTKDVVEKLKENVDLKTQIKEWKKQAKLDMTKVVQHVDHSSIQQENTHHFESNAKEYLAKATAFEKEIDLRQEDVSVVTRELIVTLQKYIEGVCGITDFIFFLEKDISNMLRSKNDLEKYRKHHFQVMKGTSKDIVHKIEVFFGCIPDIRSTIKAVPIDNNDKNFVDEWLQSKLKEIQEETSMEMSSSPI